MDERLRFVAKLLEGESMTLACREFGISRKTGYKMFNRYKESGFESLTDRSRRPVRYANQLAPQIEGMIVKLKCHGSSNNPHFGSLKIPHLPFLRGRQMEQEMNREGGIIAGDKDDTPGAIVLSKERWEEIRRLQRAGGCQGG